MMKYKTNTLWGCFLTSFFFFTTISITTGQINFDDPVLPGRVLEIDVASLSESLQNTPKLSSQDAINQAVVIELPMPDGTAQKFRVMESSMMHPDLAAQFPEIKNYVAQGIDDPVATVRFNITPLGFYGVILGSKGTSVILPHRDLPGKYRSVYERDEPQLKKICEHIPSFDDKMLEEGQTEMTNSCFQNGANLRTFRIAVTCTGEFAALNGGSVMGATAAINNILAAINVVYERDLAFRFVLIAGNNALINLNAGSDPFSNPSNSNTSLNEGSAHIHSLINVNDYDIGHSVHEANCPPTCSVGGLAGAGVCNNFVFGGSPLKAQGWSGMFHGTADLDLIMHEIGHQFSAAHTFNGTGSNCTGNISSNNAYEIGSGSSIMSYSNLCSASNNIPGAGGLADNYFHTNSLVSMLNWVTNPPGTCAALTATGNGIPTSNASPAGMTYSIPIGTPFKLTGLGSDPDGDPLTYCWEQYDEDGAGTPTQGFLGVTAGNSPIAPLFRSYPPTTDTYRIFPSLNDILNNDNLATFEALANVARTLTFRLIVRDNKAGGGGIACDETTVNVVNNGGAFKVSNFNAPSTLTADGTATTNITWDIAGTTNAPISEANVDILLSTDGGQTFSHTIALGTANDGNHTFVIPNLPTGSARFKVQASNNIFFDINNADITINSTCPANGTTFSPDNTVTANAGDPSLNLNLAPNYGTVITNFTGTLDASDPTMVLTMENGANPGTCTNPFNNMPFVEGQEFYVDATDTYSFAVNFGGGTLGFPVINLYQLSFDPNSPCTSWMASSIASNNLNGTTINNVSLNPGVKYVLATSGFSNGEVGTYHINITSTGNGQAFNGPLPPGAGFSYTYLIVNTTTGNVVAFDPNSDLSNAGSYPSGTFKVYGLSYQTGANLNQFVGGSFTNFQNALVLLTICGNLSSNNKCVTINTTTCTLTNAGLTNVQCNNNGTPADDTDDKISFQLAPTGVLLGTNGYNVTGATLTPSSGNYGASTMFMTNTGAAGAGNLNLTITDVDDQNCTLTVTVNDPGTCSGPCSLTSAGLSNVACDNNGTLADPADDKITFQLNPIGANLSANGYSVTGAILTPSTGNYGGITVFTTNAGAAGNGDLTLTITDMGDPNCTITVTVADPGTCSSTTQLTVTIASTNTVCGLDNGAATATAMGGTPNYTYAWSNGGNTATIENLPAGMYTVTATDGIGTTATASTTIAASNNLTTLTAPSGTFSDGSGANNYENDLDCFWLIQPPGATSITLNFTAFNVENGFDFVAVYDGASTASTLIALFTGSNLPPAVSSTGGNMLVRFVSDYIIGAPGWDAVYTSQVPACNLTNAGLTNIACDNNGTPANSTDDKITFQLNPTGTSLGANGYNVTGAALTPTTGTYGAPTLFSTNAGAAGAGDLNLIITDVDNPNCTLTVTVADPGTCSTAPCAITNIAVGIQGSCDPASQTYTQDIDLTFNNPPGAGQLNVNGQLFPIGTSTQTVTLAGLPANNQPVNVTAFFTNEPGLFENFEDGTTQNWTSGGPNPNPPTNVATGGPQGVNDNFLQVTSTGGGGAGSRLVTRNLTQWTGNFTANGFTTVSLDLKNSGNTPLTIRLGVTSVSGGRFVTTNAINLAANSDWEHHVIPIQASDFTAAGGTNITTTLSNVSEMRIMHVTTPLWQGTPVVATLGIDNIGGGGCRLAVQNLFTAPQNCGCVADLVVSGNPITAGTYQASNSITSDGTVANGTTVIFDATNEVLLNGNFEVEMGAVFEALTGMGCTPFAPSEEEEEE